MELEKLSLLMILVTWICKVCIVCVCISIYWGYARKSNKSDAQTLYAF